MRVQDEELDGVVTFFVCSASGVFCLPSASESDESLSESESESEEEVAGATTMNSAASIYA